MGFIRGNCGHCQKLVAKTPITCFKESMELARPTVGEVIKAEGYADETAIDCVTCNHLWMREEWFVVYGTVLTGAEATELPWRRRKDHELATPNEIRRDLELVQSLYVRGTNQGPAAFDEVKLYLREDIG